MILPDYFCSYLLDVLVVGIFLKWGLYVSGNYGICILFLRHFEDGFSDASGGR